MTTEDLQTPLGLSERFSIWSSQLLPRAMGRMNLRLIRWSGGRLGTTMRGIPIGVLTATGRRSDQVRAEVLSADERAAVWADLIEFNRVWAGFQAATDRQIEVVRLRGVS